jgi:predicted HicB family RNase H-like nuclease
MHEGIETLTGTALRYAPDPKRKVAAQWRQRLPLTLYSKLTKQAESEGVSINSLVTAIIAEAIGARRARQPKSRYT